MPDWWRALMAIQLREQAGHSRRPPRLPGVTTYAGLTRRLTLLLSLIASAELRAMSDDLPTRDVHAVFAAAEAAGRVGTARKTKPVDARPARPGEIVVTRIAGEGVETHSRPAAEGDWVTRNRCPATGNEEYLVAAETFAARYEGPLTGPDAEGWREFRPRGPELRFFLVDEREGAFRLPPLGVRRCRPDRATRSSETRTDTRTPTEWSLPLSHAPTR